MDIDWVSKRQAILKIIVLLLLPFHLSWGPTGLSLPFRNYSFVYECILFRALSQTIAGFDSPSFAYPSTVIAAVIICIPGLLFSEWVATRSRKKPVIHIAFAVAFIMALLVNFFVSYSVPEDLRDVLDFSRSLSNFALLVAIFLIFIPLIAREAPIQRYTNRQFQDDNNAGILSQTEHLNMDNTSHEHSRLFIALGLAVILMPVTLLIDSNIWGETYVHIYAPIFHLGGTITEYEHRWVCDLNYITYPIHEGTFSFLQILYGLTILWYYQGKLSKRHVFLYGILGITLPSILVLVNPPYYGGYWFTFWTPTPAFYILGFFVIHFIDRGEIIDIEEVIRPLIEREIIVPEVVPVVHEPEIKIPLWYILLSKIRTKLPSLPRKHTRSNPSSDN